MTGMKRILAIIAIISLSVAFMGCQNPFEPSSTDTTPPGAPALFSSVSKTAILIFWSSVKDSSGIAGYVVEFNGREQQQQSDTFYIESEPVTGTNTFRVLAIDNAGNRSSFSEPVAVAFVRDTIPPPSPTLRYTASKSSFIAYWQRVSDSSGIAGYVIQYNGIDQALQTDTLFTRSNLAIGAYTLRVAAIDSAGNRSAFSDSVRITIKPNSAPYLSSMSSNQIHYEYCGTSLCGGTLSLTQSAIDPDGDPLTYNWSITSGSGGRITSGSSSSTVNVDLLMCYGKFCPFTITLTASDPSGASVKKDFRCFYQ